MTKRVNCSFFNSPPSIVSFSKKDKSVYSKPDMLTCTPLLVLTVSPAMTATKE